MFPILRPGDKDSRFLISGGVWSAENFDQKKTIDQPKKHLSSKVHAPKMRSCSVLIWIIVWRFSFPLLEIEREKKIDTKVRGGSNQTWCDNGWTWLLQELAKSVAKSGPRFDFKVIWPISELIWTSVYAPEKSAKIITQQSIRPIKRTHTNIHIC